MPTHKAYSDLIYHHKPLFCIGIGGKLTRPFPIHRADTGPFIGLLLAYRANRITTMLPSCINVSYIRPCPHNLPTAMKPIHTIPFSPGSEHNTGIILGKKSTIYEGNMENLYTKYVLAISASFF